MAYKDGTGAIRTRDLPLRRRLLYPAELQPQNRHHYILPPERNQRQRLMATT